MPLRFIEPCLPTKAIKVPAGERWLIEIKHDGYRMIVRKREGRALVEMFGIRRGMRPKRLI